MGMFDWVSVYMYCPNCGEQLEGWQSKDGPCTLSQLYWTDVDKFYTSCDACDTWVELSRIPPKQMPTHVMTLEKNGEQSQREVAILPNDDVRIIDAETGEAQYILAKKWREDQ